jgi:FMN phosphatase YigB (HAD superfamily)/ribulose-5-phosphate 4-epimerase/fuculose-1-phosphate aldolase
MFYKGIILDLDNTIYDYDFAHKISIQKVFQHLNNNFNISILELKEEYEDFNKFLKNELKNTASSHNKSIYFKHIIEFFHLHYSLLPILNELYWNHFYENMKCFEGVIDFISWNKKNEIKIGVLTDYETEYQIIKLQKLGLLEMVDIIITSEEVGIEKPSIQMFQNILNKMNLLSSEVIMIGDNYEKDIQGALNNSIFSYWFHKNCIVNENYNYIEFNSFTHLLNQFKEIKEELQKFRELSRFCGERFDLVQAGGGNISCKVDDWMFIKASGYHLTNVTTCSGYSIINNKQLLNDIQNNNSNNVLKQVTEYTLVNKVRPSIETFMHSILKKYTVHLHPLQTNRILISSSAEKLVKELFPQESLFIPYLTPGIKVCYEIKSKYNNEKIIFLKNHGIIITSDFYEEIYFLLEKVITSFENNQKINFDKYKFTNILSRYINNTFGINNISYLCENSSINNYFFLRPELFNEKVTCPDILIYCGIKIANINQLEELLEYKNTYNDSPKIIIMNKTIYINGLNINKCREIEDVLLSNLIILDSNLKKDYLSNDEICFLNNWDAEKYRKLL